MNQEFKNIDDLFQSAFADDSAEVPAFVKINIDKKLGSKKNKRVWFWFSSLAVLLLVSASLLWMLDPNETNLADTSAAPTNLESKNLNSDNKNTSAYSTTSTDKTNGDLMINGENQTESKLTQPDSDQSRKSDSGNSELVESSPSHTKSNSTNSKSGSDKKNKNSTGKKLPGQEGITTSAGDEKQSTTSTDDISPLYGSESIFFQPLSVRMYEKQISGKILSPVAKSLTAANPKSANTLFGKNDIQAHSIEAEDKYNLWMITVTGGLNYSRSKYTFPTASEDEYYDKSTFPTPAFEGNADIRYRLSNSLTFGTGIGISKLTENYQFFKETMDVDTTIQWVYQDIYEYDTLLDSTIWVGIDSTAENSYDTTVVTLYNETGTTQATYLHIPFSIGTQIIRNKFRFDFYAAGRFNYLLNGKGGYLQNDVFTSFDKSANQIFKTWSIDLIIGTAVHYQLFEKLYLTGTFRFRPAIGDLYQGVNFKRSLQSYHIGVGLSWKL